MTLPRFQPRIDREAPQALNYSGGGQAVAGVAASLNQLSQTLGRAADAADMRAGEAAGAQAGFDPEFRKMDQNSAYARAFNARGTQVYLTRLETEMRGQLDQTYLQHRADPAALETAVTELREGYLSAGALAEDAELRAAFTGAFDRAALGYTREAARARLSLDESEARASALSLADERLNAIERLAAQSGLDAAADGVLAGEMTAFQETLAAFGPQGAFTLNGVEYEADPARAGAYSLEQIQTLLGAAEVRLESARIMGAFERTGGLEAQKAFRAQFVEDADGGAYPALDRDQRNTLAGAMDRSIRGLETERAGRQRDLARELDNLIDQAGDAAEAGVPFEIGFDALAQAALTQVGGDDGAALARRAMEGEALARFRAAFIGLSPAEMEDEIEAERGRLGDGASAFDVQRLTLAERVLAEARVQSQRDPLAWAAQSGRARLAPLDASSPEALGNGLASRAGQAEAVAAQFGAPVRYFTRAEAAQLTAALDQPDADRLSVAGAVIEALGPQRGAQALGELADGDWELGHIGGLASVGAERAARDLNEGVRLRREASAQGGRAPSYLPPVVQRERVQGDQMGDLLRTLPGEAQRFIQAADAIYEARARRNGWGNDAINAEGYRRSLNEAAGALYEDGVKYGGFARVNGATAIAPNWLRADRFDDAARLILSGEAGETPALYALDGSQVEPDRARRYRLYSVGAERYRVYVDENTFALDANGQPAEINMNRWRARLATARPEWVR
jgi:hypothetical protein